MTGSIARRRLTARALLVALLGGSLAGGVAQAVPALARESVIVSGAPGAAEAVAEAVRAAGGEVRSTLPIINGVAADIPSHAQATLARHPQVRAVTPDASGHLLGIDPELGYDVQADEGSLFYTGLVTKAPAAAWQKGITGKGVDIALIDSGVAEVTGLSSGNVAHGPDLSFESQIPALAHKDTFGHGTHMASIIVGRDVAGTGPAYANPSSHRFNGIAPDARLLSVKVATNSGAADVSQIIAAIDWVTQNRFTGGLNVRVINLSYGTDSRQSYLLDPLAYAVENAWRAGIVVVVAGGNDGAARTELTSPAYDPLILAVGADDTNATTAVGNDTLARFSQPGTSARHLDILAPGMHLLGLRVPGSRLDQENPQAVVGGRFFRGSGTSQAAAVLSGVAALYLSKYPGASPDAVKRALMSTATPSTQHARIFPGMGVANLTSALAMSPPNSWTQAATGSTGTGSLESARGTAHVNDGKADLVGEQDIFGETWDAQRWAAASAAGTSWNAGSWNGSTWTGSTWTGNSWNGSTWTGSTWTGNTWTGNTWTGNTWTGNTWTGSGWTGSTWTGSTWTGSTWTSDVWAGASWS